MKEQEADSGCPNKNKKVPIGEQARVPYELQAMVPFWVLLVLCVPG